MSTDLTLVGSPLPRLITDAGRPAAKRFLDFFTARIPNDGFLAQRLQKGE